MMDKIFNTSLTVEECKNILEKETRRSADRLLESDETKYVGGFHDNEFWLTTSMMLVFFENSGKILHGTIVENITKNIIKCKFGIKKTFILTLSASIRIMIFLLLASSYRISTYGIANYLSSIASYICLLLVVNIFGYCFAYYRYTELLKFVKELFKCEENIEDLENRREN